MRLLLLLFFAPLLLFARPSGLDIQKGSASVRSMGDSCTVTVSKNAALNWKDFSIGKGESVRFVQPGRDSSVLNRVTGSEASHLLGTLQSNGAVFLINPHGVYIGGDAQITTAGFLASTAEFSEIGGELHFSQPGDGEVINEGHISCPGGDIFLVAKSIRNSGTCEADFVGMATGHDILIRPHSNPKVLIRADDTDISSPYEKAISHTGTIRAFATKEEGGKIYLVAAEGATEVDGTLIGNEVHVLGQEVILKENTFIDASGPAGGTVLVGGDYQGSNPNILNAKNVYVASGARVKADSTASGDGGKVIYWSDGVTTVCGQTSVRGGPNGGDGGFIEVSGLKNFYYRGTSDSKAPCGKWGEILFDPDSNVAVAIGADANMSAGPSFAPTADTANLTPTTLEASLQSNAAVTLMTTNAGGTELGTITFTDPVTWGTGGAVENASFTCTANSAITFNADVTNNGTGAFTCSAGTSVTVASGVTVSNTGMGGITFKGTGGTSSVQQTIQGTVSTISGDIFLNPQNNVGSEEFVAIDGGTVQTTSGGLNIFGDGVEAASRAGIEMTNSATVTTETGAIALRGNFGGGVDLSFRSGVSVDTSTVSATEALGSISIENPGSAGSGGDSDDNVGVRLTSADVTSTTGAIEITGTGLTTPASERNRGIIVSGGTISSTSGNIDMLGTGGNNSLDCDGIQFQSSANVSTADGAVAMEGIGGIGPVGDPLSTGITILGSTTIEATDTGTLDLIGRAGQGDTVPRGIQISGSTISVVHGNMRLEGLRQGSNRGGGIRADGGSIIESTGRGPITLFCQAAGNSASGMRRSMSGLTLSASTVRSTLAVGPDITLPTITVTGPGGFAQGGRDPGVELLLASSIHTQHSDISISGECGDNITSDPGILLSSSTIPSIFSSTGSISLTGKSSSGFSGVGGEGVEILTPSSISITSSAPNSSIVIDGEGRSTSGGPSIGIRMNTGATVSTVDSPITFTGLGGPTGSGQGIIIAGAITTGNAITLNGTGPVGRGIDIGLASISSTGTDTTDAITITGISNATTGGSLDGVRMEASGTISSMGGNISITGNAGGDTTNNDGINITAGSVTAIGNGKITLEGIGGNGTSNNEGVSLSGAPTIISAEAGGIQITGTGAGTGSGSQGILMTNAATVSATGTGDITFLGVGGPGTTSCQGIIVQNPITLVSVENGAMSLTGNAGGSGSTNPGILVQNSAKVSLTGSGSIAMQGTGGSTSPNSYGIDILGLPDAINSTAPATGGITLTGTPGGATNEGIRIQSGGGITHNGSGTLRLVTTNSGDLLIDNDAQVASTATGNMTFNVARNLTLTGGASGPAVISPTDGRTTINVTNDLSLTPGSVAGSEVQIGNHGGVAGSASGALGLTVGGALSVDGDNTVSFALLGHGDPTTAQNLSGNISAVVSGDITVTGASNGGGAAGFAQIGHVNNAGGGSTLGGNIALTANNNLTVSGGSAAASAYGRVGHGGQAGGALFNPSEMTLIAGVDVSITSALLAGEAQVENLNGDLTFVVDNQFSTFPGMGPGAFVLNSLVTATGNLRIYTVSQGQNTINDLINGFPFIAGTFDVNSATETWGTYFPEGSYGGDAFNFYYKDGTRAIIVITQAAVVTFFQDIAANLTQLSDLLPVLKAQRLPYHFPNYHFKLCEEENCAPIFSPYGSFIFEDDLYWIGESF